MGWITPRGPGSSFIAMIALLCQDPLQESKRAFHFPIGRWTPISFTLEKRSLNARWEACITMCHNFRRLQGPGFPHHFLPFAWSVRKARKPTAAAPAPWSCFRIAS